MNPTPQENNPSNMSFQYDREFLRLKEMYFFDAQDISDIHTLLQADKNLIISHFHNLFSSNEEKSLTEIEQRQKRGFDNPEEEKIYAIFQRLTLKHHWIAGLNIESFIEEYKTR